MRNLFLSLLLLTLTGCAATTTFTPYPSKINPLKADLALGKPVDFAQTLAKECNSADMILYSMERGRSAQILDSLDISMREFLASLEKIKENDDKAVVSASEIGSQAAAVMVNDNAIPYQGYGYERVALHHYQALNYLKKNDLDGAMVEIRMANAEQDEQQKKYEKEIEEAREKAQEKKIGEGQLGAVYSRYAQLDEVAGSVKSSFQNAYTFYLSGIAYELAGEDNDAYIDYKKALEIYPENSFLKRDVLRLAAKLSMADDMKELRERFSMEVPEIPTDSGDVVIFYEDGFVPEKKEIKISVPIPGSGIVSMAFPIYEAKWGGSQPIEIKLDGESFISSEQICDFRVLAVKALKEKIPSMATRQIIRAVTKATAAHEAKKRGGALGELMVSVWNVLSENADLRSWLTLPASAHIARLHLPEGAHRLAMPAAGKEMDLTVKKGNLILIHVIRTGNSYHLTATTLSSRNRVASGG